VQNCEFLDCELFHEYEKISTNKAKLSQTPEILNKTYKPTLA
jgi:hypothetical protein